MTGASFGDPLPSLRFSGDRVGISGTIRSINESGRGNFAALEVILPEAPASYPLIVNVTSSDLTELNVQGPLEIKSGLRGTFLVYGVDDSDPDGDREVTISATAEGFRGAVTTAVSYTHLTLPTMLMV